MATKTAKRSKKAWSEEDISYLRENYGVTAKKTMMKHLGRTARAIEHKAIELFGTSRVTNVAGTYTNGDIAKFFNKDVSTVNLWIGKLNFPAIRYTRVTKKANMKYAYYYMVDYDDFWSWLKKNKSKVCVDLKEVDLEVFGGICPDWFMEDYKNKVVYGTQKRWTKAEEKTLNELYYKKNLSATEVAKIMGRTPVSVRKKIKRINDKLKLFGLVS